MLCSIDFFDWSCKTMCLKPMGNSAENLNSGKLLPTPS